MSKSNMLTRKGVQVAVIPGGAGMECDLCGSKDAPKFMLWDSLDIPALDDYTTDSGRWDMPSTLTLCEPCDSEEIAKVEEYVPGTYEYKDGKLQPISTSTTPSPSTLVPKTTYVPKCMKPHFYELDRPGMGTLYLSSERGGPQIAVEADYGLFFSAGWKEIREPSVELWQPGTRPNTIPNLAEDDFSAWPPMAFVYWRDYSAPNPDVVRYAQWAAKEWAAGKSIQFGCMGGHGRTGTFAALLLVEALNFTGEAAVEWVRKHYCADAIEGAGQTTFVKKYTAGQDPKEASW